MAYLDVIILDNALQLLKSQAAEGMMVLIDCLHKVEEDSFEACLL